MDEVHSDAAGPDNGFAWSPSNPDSSRRACDACRARKIRCDRDYPCSHCLSSKLVCVYSAVKPPKKRTRILLTQQYERKLDQIDDRLESAIRLLENLSTSGPSDASNSQSPSHAPIPAKASSTNSTPICNPIQPKWTHGQVMHGDSSLAAHSVFANAFVQKVAATDSLRDTSPEVSESLDELSQILTQQTDAAGQLAYPNARPIQRSHLPECDMPPIKKAVEMIRIAKAERLAGTGWIYEFLPFQRFSDMCLEVYFNENHSEADYITVNVGLYSLFSDYSFHVSAEDRDEYLGHAHLCRDNLETALSNLALHLPATSNMVLALIFGSFYAIELSKPSLSWTLLSKASELGQTLAYHRIASMQKDKPEEIRYKQFLFWSIYFIDKTLSLRLGRPSTIPDWDITIPRPRATDTHAAPVQAYFVLWIETARCQGNIYEMLYSPNSLAQTGDTRQSRVEALVSDLHNLDAATQTTNEKWIKEASEKSGEELMNFFYISDHVLRLSLLTLVYRAAPQPPNSATTFSPDCVAAARATLDRHEECIEVMRASRTPYFSKYMHWTLLFTPFIPYIVIFCHVIETQDRKDLARLQAFVSSIQCAPSVSDPAARMHRLFHVLCSVALRYVEHHKSTPHAGQKQASAKMDSYLSSLGFSSVVQNDGDQQQQHRTTPLEDITGDGITTADGLRTTNPIMWTANGAELEDWLENNDAMDGLLGDLDFSL